MTDLSTLDVVEKAKRIRAELKAAFPGAKFKVRSDRFSMGEAIDITWTDGPATTKVEKILRKYESIDRDPTTSEILAGSNSYVHGHRYYSEGTLAAMEKKARERFVEGTWGEWNSDPKLRTFVWQELTASDLPTNKAPEEGTE